ncbi:hypothetical protein [Cetobacterium sp.]|uniref:hypothetical protein n=1 Tax=Cetobacterium sp. TaxID=2071632 RepID=UPI002FCB69BC
MEKKLNLLDKIALISMMGGPGLSYGKIYLYHIVSIIYIIKFFIENKKIEKKYLKKNMILILFFCFSVFRLISVKSLEYGLKNQVYLIIGLNIYILLHYFLNKNTNETLNMLKKIVIFAIVVGYFESFGYFRWYTTIYESNVLNPASFYGNMNDFAVLLTLVFPFIILYKNKFKSFICGIIIIILLLKCDSRAANIAIILQIIIICFFKAKNKILFLIISVFGMILNLNIIVEKIDFLIKFIKFSSTKMDSIGIRQELIKKLVKEILSAEKFIFGIGGGNSKIISGKIAATYSFLLELFVEYGVIIFILLILFYLKLLIKNFSYIDCYKIAIFTSLIGFLVSVNAMSGGIYYFPFWIMLSLSSYEKGV